MEQNPLMQSLEKLAALERYVFLLDEQRFWNPLIPAQYKHIRHTGLLDRDKVLEVIEMHLVKHELDPGKGMYFPVPIARKIEQNVIFNSILVKQFHYHFIEIDDRQQWYFHSRPVTGKVLKYFQSHMSFEPETNRYYVEYWSESRWDKCYLSCTHTPMEGLALERIEDTFMVTLNNGKSDSIRPDSFRLDAKERCFCSTMTHGEVMLADSPRYWLLSHFDSDCTQLRFVDRVFPLQQQPMPD